MVGVAVDADEGRLLLAASTGTGADWQAGEWRTAFSCDVRPSATAGGWIYPVLSGDNGVRVEINFGLDLALQPLRQPPPSSEFKPWANLVSRMVRLPSTRMQRDGLQPRPPFARN